MSKPLVSIMIPTYNRPHFFERTLQSAMQQKDYDNIEIVITDNSTNDETEKLMEKYIKDRRIKYFRNKSAKTKEDNFAPMEKLAEGEYLQWLMDDDILAPHKIAAMMDIFEQNKGITLVSSERGIIDGNGKYLGKVMHLPAVKEPCSRFAGADIGKVTLLDSSNIIGEPSAALFRRKDLEHHYWRADSRGYLAISDVAMWCELFEKGDCVIFFEPLSFYRRHAGQEGQEVDVVFLAMCEWYRLITDYYERKVFLTEEKEYIQALAKVYFHCRDNLGPFLQQTTPRMHELFSIVNHEMEIRLKSAKVL